MATAIQRRRGTTSQHSSFTGLVGEITIDTDKKVVVVHDGSTAGGVPMATAASVTALGGADITSVVAGNGLSGGSTSGDATINLDLSELSAATVNVANDSIAIVDADDSNGSKKESIADFVSAIAGSGLSASSGQLSISERGDISAVTAGDGLSGGGNSGAVSLALDLNELSAATVAVDADSIAIIDASDNSSKKESIADLVAGMAGTNLTASSGTLGIASSVIRGLFSAGGDLSYNSGTGAFSFTNDAGDIEGVTAGVGLSGGGTSGTVSLALDFSELDDMTGTMDATDEFIILDSGSGNKRKAANEIGLSIFNNDSGFTTNVGDITAVVAGTNLNGGATSGSATVNLDTALTGMTSADFSGNVDANFFVGTATQARYADLAEKYEADAEYEPGTVLVIGGDKEVTVTDEPGSHAVVGVVSTDPAYLMNSEAEGVAIALRGRIPCKVAGVCRKGDVLVTSDVPGHAMVALAPTKLSPLQIIGRALAHKTEAAPGLVEIIV